jgi:hypothetical protein
MLVIDALDLKANRAITLRRIFAFLGADEMFVSNGFTEDLNPSQGKRRYSRRYERMRASFLGAAWRRLPERLRVPVATRVMRAATAPATRPPLSPEFRLKLEAVFRPEADRLRELTGQSFASWSL